MMRRHVPAALLALAAGGCDTLPRSPADAPGLTWFAWRAAPWIASPASQLALLPAGSRRLLLGLTAQEMRAAATAGRARQQLHALHAEARAAGLRVELLLGDPSWAHAPQRHSLLALLRLAAALPFDGLNLDLERDPHAPQATWHGEVARTLSAVRAECPWPIALTTHDNDITQAFATALAQAGVSEVVPMIYVSFEHLVRRRAGRVLAEVAAGAPGMRVTVAQSIERHLARGESWHRLGRRGALAAWAELSSRLGAHAPFAGLAVQSFEEFVVTPA